MSAATITLLLCAQVVLLAVPGDERQEAIDQQGLMALAVLRALGLPTVVGVVQLEGGPSGGGKGGGNAMKARSAAKKRGAAALQEQVPGEYKVLLSDSVADMQQVGNGRRWGLLLGVPLCACWRAPEWTLWRCKCARRPAVATLCWLTLLTAAPALRRWSATWQTRTPAPRSGASSGQVC